VPIFRNVLVEVAELASVGEYPTLRGLARCFPPCFQQRIDTGRYWQPSSGSLRFALHDLNESCSVFVQEQPPIHRCGRYCSEGNAILGVLYGASAAETLDQNRIFARWLQKKIMITDSSGALYPLQGSYGPDRQWFTVSNSITGTVLVYAPDGMTPEAAGAVTVKAGEAYWACFHSRANDRGLKAVITTFSRFLAAPLLDRYCLRCSPKYAV